MSSLEESNQRQRIFRSTKKGYLKSGLAKIKNRCKKNNIPFDLTYEFLESISTERCPVFNTEFVWQTQGTGRGPKENTPTLDRIIPELGYVQGNVVFISILANAIKQNVTEKELYAVADWLHDKRKEVLHAFKDKLTRLPAPPDTPGKRNAAHGVVHGAGPGQDCDGAHHHQGEPAGPHIGDRAQAGGGVGVGPGVPEVGAPIRPPSGARDGHARATFEGALQQLQHLRNQPGKRGLARGTLARWAVRLFNNRRVQQVQGPKHQTIQGAQEGTKNLQAKIYSHRHTDAAGGW